MSDAGVELLARLQQEYDLDRSTVIRACIAVALPRGELRTSLTAIREAKEQ